jgi:predicted metalloprotease
MRWEDLPQSDNIEDRRHDDGYIDQPGDGVPGGYRDIPVGAGGLSIGTILVLGLLGWALGVDPRFLLDTIDRVGPYGAPHYEAPIRESPRRTGTPADDMGRFVSAVLGSADVQWRQILAEHGQTYRPPRLILFRNHTDAAACGMAQSAMGPFYCPPTREIYLDTSFFDELQRRFRGCSGKACEFARAYVIAHEVGHHVQNLLGILGKAQQAQRVAGSAVAANRIKVRVELQADCFAGVWAHHADRKWKFMEPGDVEAALQTASAIGDDMLQRRTQGRVVPESFTHGSSEQRRRWFTIGWKNGTLAACDTFNAAQL